MRVAVRLQKFARVATVAAAVLAATAVSPVGASAASLFDRWVLSYETVQAHDTDAFTVRTRASRIWVRGDGSTDLDCRLYRYGVQISSDTDNTDVCLLYTDGSGGPFRLTVRNWGDVHNNYVVEAED